MFFMHLDNHSENGGDTNRKRPQLWGKLRPSGGAVLCQTLDATSTIGRS
jgi:hypothetical protein